MGPRSSLITAAAGQGNHLGGAYGRALFHAVGAELMSNALAQEKTGGHGSISSSTATTPRATSRTPRSRSSSAEPVAIPRRRTRHVGPAGSCPGTRIGRSTSSIPVGRRPRNSPISTCRSGPVPMPGVFRRSWPRWSGGPVRRGLPRPAHHGRRTGARRTSGGRHRCPPRRCGVDQELIRATARRIAGASSAATYEDLGVQQSRPALSSPYLNKMMWILTGNFARPGGVHIHSWMVPDHRPVAPDPAARPRPCTHLRRRVGLAAMGFSPRPCGGSCRRSRAGPPSPGPPVASRPRSMTAFFDAVSGRRRTSDRRRTGPVRQERADAGQRRTHTYGLTPCSAIADEILQPTTRPDCGRCGSTRRIPRTLSPKSARFRAAMREWT